VAALLNHFGGQVLGCAAIREPPVIVVEVVRPAKVSQLDNAVDIEKDILRLDVSVDNGRVERVKITTRGNAFPKILSGHLFAKPALLLEHGVNLPLGTVLQYEVKVVVVLVVVVQLENVVVVQLVHDLDLQLDLLHQIVLKDLLFIDNLDCINILRDFMSYFINFTKATDANVAVGKGFEVVFTTLSFLAAENGGGQEEHSVFDVVDLVDEFGRHLDGLYNCFFL